ncbi:DUF1674 domain-containing protein [Methylomonas sp. EFPC3]|uniref:DUF1674 domain-containing protein n=1 Tax=Methylomonas TaxID=416 RepID=UPI00112CEE6C|nr:MULTISPECIES: succinate dehydrogenase assembly factor 4 [Methylomonas]TPQ24871.1 DUF1674 domain-containing protein [Methylomonas koyamae]WFP51612.1 DUF1674 domain-containing protein [Methylomonas sp. EFPC3]
MTPSNVSDEKVTAEETAALKPASAEPTPAKPEEFNGPKGPEPTRFGDWERKGRCVDF